MYVYIIIVIAVIIIFLYYTSLKISKNYYTVDEVCGYLNNIHTNIDEIKNEVSGITNNYWTDWPEKELYDSNTSRWNIYPFTAFNVMVDANCKQCPRLWDFIKNIPGLKLATLSRLGPGTKLNQHMGWGNHSNYVIRCHFGLSVPDGCYMSVDDEIKLHKNNEWMIFDDSKNHYAHNPTNTDRIILIVDIVRPPHIRQGTSDVGDTKELIDIIKYFDQSATT